MTALLETPRTTRRAAGRRLKQVLLGFWAMYFSIVAVSNAINLLDVSGALHWHFLNSTNFEFMRSMVKVYGLGAGETKLLLAGALAVEAAGAVLFVRALRDRDRALPALAFGAFVWTAFTFMCELFLGYTSEGVFRELLGLTIGTALVVALVPDEA